MLNFRRLFYGSFLAAYLLVSAASAADKKATAPQYRWDAWIVTPLAPSTSNLLPGDVDPTSSGESCGAVPQSGGAYLWQDARQTGCWYSGQNTGIAPVYAKTSTTGLSIFHFATSPAHPVQMQGLTGILGSLAAGSACASPIPGSAGTRPDCLLNFLNNYPQPQPGFEYLSVNFQMYPDFDLVQQAVGEAGRAAIYSTSFMTTTLSASTAAGTTILGAARQPYAGGTMSIERIAPDYWKLTVDTPLRSPDSLGPYERSCTEEVQRRKTVTTCTVMSWAEPGTVTMKFEMIFRRTLIQ